MFSLTNQLDPQSSYKKGGTSTAFQLAISSVDYMCKKNHLSLIAGGVEFNDFFFFKKLKWNILIILY